MPTRPVLARRDLLKLCGAGAAALAAPSVALAQAPAGAVRSPFACGTRRTSTRI